MDLILIELIINIVELNLEIVGKIERLSKKSLKTIFYNRDLLCVPLVRTLLTFVV